MPVVIFFGTIGRMIGPYTQEQIRNLNEHCNDSRNSSLECEFSRGTNSYTCKHMCAQTRLPKDV